MKNILFSGWVALALLTSCNTKNKETTTESHNMMDKDSTMMDEKVKMMENHTDTYACPMHPEVQGKIDDKCPKCGMNLTEPVADKVEKGE
jgi:hypothetical protein